MENLSRKGKSKSPREIFAYLMRCVASQYTTEIESEEKYYKNDDKMDVFEYVRIDTGTKEICPSYVYKVVRRQQTYPEYLNPFADDIDEYPDYLNPFSDVNVSGAAAYPDYLNPFSADDDVDDVEYPDQLNTFSCDEVDRNV